MRPLNPSSRSVCAAALPAGSSPDNGEDPFVHLGIVFRHGRDSPIRDDLRQLYDHILSFDDHLVTGERIQEKGAL